MDRYADIIVGTLGAARYAGVLAVWAGLLLIRPALAVTLLRERRADSPIPRFGASRPFSRPPIG